jgi:hypothetical protein
MSNPQGLTFKTQLTDSNTVAQEELGIIRTENDSATDGGYKVYKYVQAAADTTVANGTPLLYVTATTNRTIVTLDLTDANTNNVAGVGVGAIAASSYGWIQLKGYHSAVITNADDDISANDAIIYGAADGVVDSVAAGTAPTNAILGFAVADDVNADDTVATLLTISA